ncbi:MAG: metallopeptidase [Firmicutes bacterium]|nr:metallopeptidase [Bacillota bacterium]MBQ9016583.1 metallopeptidase [Bacillota bacterium]
MSNTDFENSKEWEVSSAKLAKAHGYADGSQNHAKTFDSARRAAELALQILRLSRNTLMVDLRYLEAAFVKIVPAHDRDTLEIATDGQFLYYNSLHVCRQYRQAKEIPVRDYLHVTLHCLFRHLFISRSVRADVWDLACDIAVENIINGLDLRAVRCERQTAQMWLIRQLAEELPKLSAEWIYKYFMEQDPSPEEVQALQKNFHADDHSVWHTAVPAESTNGDPEENEPGNPEGEDSADSEESAAPQGEPEEGEDGETTEESEEYMEAVPGEDEHGPSGGGDDDRQADTGEPALKPEDIEQAWKEIAERIEVDMDTSSDSWGEGAGDMQQQLREINREKYDYTELLRRFSVLGENVEVNDDEFDYIFYTYGLKLYENMPLVEPLEYKDVKKVREFVIALDTSESVAGDTVQKFVTKTWNILKQSENFFTRVNVHIIQCGARVEEDVRITTEEEFDDYMEHMVLKGFGGTDFRPVFEHVDSLLRQHEFTNFKGLIYFTDGFGTFPHEPPAYDAAFVFLDQGYELPEVPVWAIRMVLREDEIQQF